MPGPRGAQWLPSDPAHLAAKIRGMAFGEVLDSSGVGAGGMTATSTAGGVGDGHAALPRPPHPAGPWGHPARCLARGALLPAPRLGQAPEHGGECWGGHATNTAPLLR